MVFRAYTQYLILKTILDFNLDNRSPKLEDIRSICKSNISNNSLKWNLSELKANGLITANGTRANYAYHITNNGILALERFDSQKEKEKLSLMLQFIGD